MIELGSLVKILIDYRSVSNITWYQPFDLRVWDWGRKGQRITTRTRKRKILA